MIKIRSLKCERKFEKCKMEKVILFASFLWKKGFIHIFGTGMLNKVLAFISSILIVRILPQNDYGIVSYAMGIIQTLVLFSGIGMDTVILQYTPECDLPEKKYTIYKFSCIIGTISNVICILLLFGIKNYVRDFRCIILLSFLPVLIFIYSIFASIFRAEFDNRSYSLLANIHSLSYSIIPLLCAYKYGIIGCIAGYYIGYIFPALYILIRYRMKVKKIFCAPMPCQIDQKQYLRYGGFVIICNAASQILYHMDVVFVGSIVNTNISVANYKAAANIPTALATISSLFCTFIYPYFVKHRKDRKWVYKKWKLIVIGTLPIYIFIGIVSMVYAEPIIRLLYGDAYLDSVICFKILMFSFILSSGFRILSGNILAMLRQIKANFIFSVIESIANIILDIYLIRIYGGVGAAIATSFVILLSSIMSTVYLIYYCKKKNSEPERGGSTI